METYRIFVSSPGDAHFERLRVDRVVARLNGELAGAVRLATVRWETAFYSAHDTFQAQIPLSTDCSIVLAIFRGRLGTELPPEFPRMPDGEAYPSGTAYEVLTAIAKRQQGSALPDVFVFRCTEPPTVRLDDEASEDEVRTQWARLKRFFTRWFVTEQGHFRAAFDTFATPDDFEQKLERLLRDWLRERLGQSGTVAWPIATMGSPYPGLQSFGPRHAPVFFGRARDTARIVEAWSEAGRRGTPFLLVVGASGSGKSSLARAGLVPRLTTPGVVDTVDCWRVAALRPGESPDGPIAALAHALMQGAADLPRSEEGRPPALPEIAAGDYRTPADLAALLAHADAAAVRPLLAALDKVGEAERAAHAMQGKTRCDLVILVDQLDELFAATLDADTRRRFAQILEHLVATGRVWVVATLRADLYGLLLKDEVLFRLKDKGVAHDLAPPALADMAEAVRGPARAANLTWEVDAGTRESLDDRLIGDIDRPDLLPIVQFVLDRLFAQRGTQDGRVVLTHAAYQALGTLNGAIDTAAEAALAPLGPAAIAALPRLLRSLVVHAAGTGGAAGATLALRQAQLAALAQDEATRGLVRALTDARILVSGRDAADAPVVGLAHQRVIEAWARARDIIAQSADLLRVREEVEEASRRWDAAGRRNDLLIRPGLALSEAEHAAAALGDELPPGPRAFVERSTAAAKLRQRLTAIAAGVFLALAIGAGVLGFIAREQPGKAEQAAAEAQAQMRLATAARAAADEQRKNAEAARALAEEQRQKAEDAQRTILAESVRTEEARKLADARRRDAELRLAAADELMEPGKAEQLRQCLASTQRLSTHPAPQATRAYFVARWHVDQVGGSSDIDWREDGTCDFKSMLFANGAQAVDTKGDVCTWSFEALPDNEFAINVQSAALGDRFPKRLRFKPVSPTRIRNVDANYDATRIVCPAQELTLDRAVVADLKDRVAAPRSASTGNMTLQRDLANAIDRLGAALAGQGDLAGALAQYQDSLKLRLAIARTDDENRVWQRDLSSTLLLLGLARAGLKQDAAALDAYRSSLAIRLNLYSEKPTDAVASADLAFAHERIGDLLARMGNTRAEARDEYQLALNQRSDLTMADPNNAQRTTELIVVMYKLGSLSDSAKAKVLLGKALELAELLDKSQSLAPEYADLPKFLKGELAKLK